MNSLKWSAELIDLVPTEFYLGQNYPNPFKERTMIKYCVGQKSRVTLTVYNSNGEMVERLVDGEKEPGTYEVTWSAKHLQNGKYKYEMKSGNYTSAKEMTILR